MRLALTEVYEVATFYAHPDVVKEGETPPPAITVRVRFTVLRDGGREGLLRDLPARLRGGVRSCARLAWAPVIGRRSVPSAMAR
jgi:formate dehydrogenase